MSENRNLARQLASEAVTHGRPLSWFEQLYSQAAGDESAIPWADMTANPNLKAWLEAGKVVGASRSALVVGCGLGDDAELLADIGFRVTAFDISPTSVAWCRQRFPSSPVRYQVADLFDVPRQWRQTFDFVFEAYTLQVLPTELRRAAIGHLAECVAPGGTLLVITRGRDESDDPGTMPWPLWRGELEQFVECDLVETKFEDYIEAEDPPVRRFRVEYRR